MMRVSVAPRRSADSSAPARIASARASRPRSTSARAQEEQRRGAPLARRRQAGQRGLDVRAHLLDSVAAQRRAQERDRRRDGGVLVERRLERVPALGRGEPALGRRRPAAECVDPASDHGDRRVALEPRFVVERVEPPLDVGDPAAVVGGQRDRGHDPCHPIGCRRSRMAERGLGVAVRLEPVGCPAMEHGAELGLVLGQLTPEQIPKQRVAAVRLALSVEWGDEQVHTLERGEHAPGARRGPVRRRTAARSAARAPTYAGGRSPGRASAATGTRSGSTRPGTDRRLPGPRAADPLRLRFHASAPRRMPAAQPSHRSRSSAAVLVREPRIRARASSASLSRWVSASSSPRPPAISPLCAQPRDRQPRRDARPTSASIDPGGTCPASVESTFVELRERSRWALSTTSTKLPSRAQPGREPWELRVRRVRVERSDPVECRSELSEQDGRVVVALVDREPRERPAIPLGPLRERASSFRIRPARSRVTSGGRCRPQAVHERRPRHRPGRRGRHANLCFDDVRRLRLAFGRSSSAACPGSMGGWQPRTSEDAPLFPVGWHQARTGPCATLRSG